MGWLFGKKKSTPPDCEKFDGKLITYAVRRDPEGEIVIGKDGRICSATDLVELRFSDGSVPFACPAETAQFGELMSNNGVIITGDDQITGTRVSVVAYYRYYRK